MIAACSNSDYVMKCGQAAGPIDGDTASIVAVVNPINVIKIFRRNLGFFEGLFGQL